MLLKDILQKLCDDSSTDKHEMREILVQLQKHALGKLEANKRFNADGIALFTLKLVGNYSQNNQENNAKISKKKFKYETSIDLSGHELKMNLIRDLKLNCDNLNLICNGKLINDEQFIRSQEIKVIKKSSSEFLHIPNLLNLRIIRLLWSCAFMRSKQ